MRILLFDLPDLPAFLTMSDDDPRLLAIRNDACLELGAWIIVIQSEHRRQKRTLLWPPIRDLLIARLT